MYLVGLTGGIATGKSSVSNILRELDCTIIDADLIARQGDSPPQQSVANGLIKAQSVETSTSIEYNIIGLVWD